MKLRRLIVSAFLCVLVGVQFVYPAEFPETKPEKVGLSSERLSRIDRVMTESVDDGYISGSICLVARDGKIAYEKTFGMMDVEKGIPMSEDAMFMICSMSKPMTATAIMMLYEEGRFLLSDPVSKFIPEFADPEVIVQDPDTGSVYTVPARSEITIRNLLTHTSGITYGEGLQRDIYREAGMTVGLTKTEGTLGEMIRKLGSLPLISHPGEEVHYGMSIDTLGYLVEVVSGQPFNEFMRERLWGPLEMDDTHFILPREKLSRLARHYTGNGNGVLKLVDADPSWLCDQTYFSGGAGVVTTTRDYLRFAQMLLNGGELDGVRILSPKTVQLMTTNAIGDLTGPFPTNSGDKMGYGLGIRASRGTWDELESLGIFGWDGAFYTRFWADPAENLIGLFMTQIGGAVRQTGLTNRYRVLVYQAIMDSRM